MRYTIYLSATARDSSLKEFSNKIAWQNASLKPTKSLKAEDKGLWLWRSPLYSFSAEKTLFPLDEAEVFLTINETYLNRVKANRGLIEHLTLQLVIYRLEDDPCYGHNMGLNLIKMLYAFEANLDIDIVRDLL